MTLSSIGVPIFHAFQLLFSCFDRLEENNVDSGDTGVI